MLSEVRRPKPDIGVLTWLDEVDEDRCFVSVATFAELRRGIQQMDAGKPKDALSDWLENDLADRFSGRIIPVDRTVAFAWGDLLASTKRAGHKMSTMDGWIAATAIVASLDLVTRNTKDFTMADLRLVNPWMTK